MKITVPVASEGETIAVQVVHAVKAIVSGVHVTVVVVGTDAAKTRGIALRKLEIRRIVKPTSNDRVPLRGLKLSSPSAGIPY